jgi:fatty-acyl-CoA synthase
MAILRKLLLDVRYVRDLSRAYALVRKVKPDSPTTIADLIEARVAEGPDRPAILFEDRVVTYAELDAQANRIARWASGLGLGRGDVVALLMENRPEYVCTWLGLAKIGAVTALINTNLRGQPLAHSLSVAEAKHLVLGAELADALGSARAHVASWPEVWAAGGDVPGAHDLDAALATQSGVSLGREARKGVLAGDRLFYIYTSGTTGLPKAANVSHQRAIMMGGGAAAAQGLTHDDRVYVTLPLYHSAGGVMAAGAGLLSGGAIALTRKFSASRFWSDCVRYDATAFQYIGELCRYLLHTPEHPDETRHRIRVCIGNGLRPEVWEPFQKRFRIPRIVEFYGATEGNVVLMNFDGKLGSVGRMPRFVRRLMGIQLVRYDVDKDAHVRGADGFCVPCGPGEVGEAIGRITERTRFEGYTNAEATQKKVLRDVFAKGDTYFRTGDLLRYDGEDYFYFVDRIGDTFRWKGENVATSEVAEVLSRCPGVREANVYGVSVPGQDGRAGMVALVVDEGFDPGRLALRVTSELPAYARPLFLRLREELEVTGTFKHRKVDLVDEGFDPQRVAEPLLFFDAERACYVPLDAALHARLTAGAVRI